MCRRPVYWIREGPRRSDINLIRLALQSWKSARGQNVLQTGVLDLGESQEVSYGLVSIGTGTLEVFERPEGVTDRCNELGRVPGDQSGLMSIGNAILDFYEGSERVTD